MAQHLARGCFRMGTRNTKQDGELDRRWLWQRRHVDMCGQTYGLRGWWGSEPGDRQLNCRAGSIPDIRVTKLHDDKQIFYDNVE